MIIQQGLSGAKRVLPVIDEKPEIKDNENVKDLNFTEGEITFENVNFDYLKENKTLNSINLKFMGKK